LQIIVDKYIIGYIITIIIRYLINAGFLLISASALSKNQVFIDTNFARMPGGIGRASTRTTNNRDVFWEEKTAENLLAI
jgi:hypothetical protein